MSPIKKNFFLTLTVMIITVGALFGGGFFLLWAQIIPLSQEFSSTQRSIKIAEDEITYDKKIVGPNLEKNAGDFAHIKEMFYVPSDEGAYKLILFFEAAARRNSLTEHLTLPPSDTGSTVGIQVSGSFINILKFLREIENDKYLLKVDNLSLQGNGEVLSAALNIILRTP